MVGRQWQIGDPVDETTDGWMDAQNWPNRPDSEESARDFTDSRVEEYGKKAWALYMDFRDGEALNYIDKALKLNDHHAANWNRKAIILESLKRYPESEECYNRSLELSRSDMVFDNKARMLYDWAYELLEESKKGTDGLKKLEKANEKILKSIRALSGDSDEDIEKCLNLRDSIRYNIDYQNKYLRNLETLRKYDKTELFTITGTKFYKGNISPGAALRLVKEPDNEFDRDAIAVYFKDDKIGYVANNEKTRYYMTSSASELKDKIESGARAEYLLYLDRYA